MYLYINGNRQLESAAHVSRRGRANVRGVGGGTLSRIARPCRLRGPIGMISVARWGCRWRAGIFRAYVGRTRVVGRWWWRASCSCQRRQLVPTRCIWNAIGGSSVRYLFSWPRWLFIIAQCQVDNLRGPLLCGARCSGWFSRGQRRRTERGRGWCGFTLDSLDAVVSDLNEVIVTIVVMVMLGF